MQRAHVFVHPWISPAEAAAQVTFCAHASAGFHRPLSRYPVGCGFVQRMRQPAVWCASVGAPCPHQDGGGLMGRPHTPSAAAVAAAAGARQHVYADVHSLRHWAEGSPPTPPAHGSSSHLELHAGAPAEAPAAAADRGASASAVAPVAAEHAAALQGSQLDMSGAEHLQLDTGIDADAFDAACISLAGPAPIDNAGSGAPARSFGPRAWCIEAEPDTQRSERVVTAPQATEPDKDLGSATGHCLNSAVNEKAQHSNVQIDMFSWGDMGAEELQQLSTLEAVKGDGLQLSTRCATTACGDDSAWASSCQWCCQIRNGGRAFDDLQMAGHRLQSLVLNAPQ
jgi:hypothetical protein